MIKILWIESGQKHDEVIDLVFQRTKNKQKINLTKQSICEIFNTDLINFDIIIIPSFSNQDILFKIKRNLENFVKFGGVLVIFGARADKHDWIPFSLLKYRQRYLKQIEIKEKGNLFSNLKIEDPNTLKFHDEFITHGYFIGDEELCIPLISGQQKEIVASIIQPPDTTGKIFVTTIDPDYHAIIGYTKSKEELEFNENAFTFFRNIIFWAVDQNNKKSTHSFGKIQKDLIKELTIYFSQVFVFFCVSIMISNMLTNEENLTKYISSKVNNYSLIEILYIIVATIFVVGFLYILGKILNKFDFAEEIIDDILRSIHRTIYFFGSSVAGIMLAIATSIAFHSKVKKLVPIGWIIYAVLFGISIFIYGYAIKTLLSKVFKSR